MIDLKTTFPRLRFAMEEYLAPRGLTLAYGPTLPVVYARQAALAEAELCQLSNDDIVALASTDDEEHKAVAMAVPNAADLVVCAWEGQLGRALYA